MSVEKKPLHPAWVVAGISFLVLLVSAGIRATPGVLIVPLEQEFAWTRASISSAISVNLVLYGLAGPFSAAMVDRLGLKRTMLVALGLIVAGVCLATQVTQTWHFAVLWGVLIGGGTGMTAIALSATVVNRWFFEKRGLVQGMLTASVSTGQLVFLPLLATVIEQVGWRPAILIMAAMGLAVMPLVYRFVRNRPADLGLLPYGARTQDDVPITPPRTNPFLAPFRTLASVSGERDFWLLFLTFYVCGLSTNGLIGTHLIAACSDLGIPEVKAAGLLAVMGILDLIGTTGSGWLSDRLDNRYLLFWYYGLRGLSLIYLPYALTDPVWGLGPFAIFYGLDWIATVPPTVRLAANVFGRERVGMVFGWIACGHQLGAATAAFGAGYLRTELGDYQTAFILGGAACLAAAAMSLAIGGGRAAKRTATA